MNAPWIGDIMSFLEKSECVNRVKVFVGKDDNMVYEHLFVVLYLKDCEHCVDESEFLEQEILKLGGRVIIFSLFD